MRSFTRGFSSSVVLAVVWALSAAGTFAQDLNPIRWSIKQEDSASITNRFNIQVIAAIDEGWHLYSIEQPAGGPIPTRIWLPEDQKFKLAGDIESPLPQVQFDKNFNIDTQSYETGAIFKLPVEIAKETPSGKSTVTVNVFFQTCNDKICLPPKTVKLSTEVQVVGSRSPVSGSTDASNAGKDVSQAVRAQESSISRAIEFEFTDFTGKARRFSEFRGRIVLIDFWATWCGPCLADIPKLNELRAKYGEKGFEVLGMNAETIGDQYANDAAAAKEAAIAAKRIVTARGAAWTHADSATALPIAIKIFDVKTLPTKVLIGRDGKVIAKIGAGDDLEKIVANQLVAK